MSDNGPTGRDLPQLLGFVIKESKSFVPTELGVTVLYGLNGAGKTRTLNEMVAFWRGEESTAFALVRLPDLHTRIVAPYYKGDEWARSWLGEVADWLGRSPFEPGKPAEILDEWVSRSLYSEDIESDAPAVLRCFMGDRDAGLAKEWSATRLILIRASGTAAVPKWHTSPAFVTGQGRSFANQALEIVDLYNSSALDAEYPDALDAHHLNAEPVTILPSGHTILDACRNGVGITAWDSDDHASHASVPLTSPSVAQARSGATDERTREYLNLTVTEQVQVENGAVVASEELRQLVKQLVRVANEHYRSALLDAPLLRLHVEVVGLDTGAEWYAEGWAISGGVNPDQGPTTSPRDTWLVLDRLSRAQRRWAEWSINRALDESGPESLVSRVLFLDEPEAALHRSAESHMARYLAALGRDHAVVAATHSPELLDLDESRTLEVRRVGMFRKLMPLTDIAKNTIAELGLNPSDLLRRQRGILLVEGQHDVDVVHALLGDELRRLRVEVYAISGTKNLNPAAVRFLYDHTDAHVFVMLDNVTTKPLAATWTAALDAVVIGGPIAATQVLDSADCLKATGKDGGEGPKLRSILQAEIESGTQTRLTPHGLTHRDVIEYLPVSAFVTSGASWADLRTEHDAARGAVPGTAADFKAWLRIRHKADTSVEAVAAAARQLDRIPEDFVLLLRAVEAQVSNTPGSRDLSEM